MHARMDTYMGAGCKKVLPSSRKSTNTCRRKNGLKTPAFSDHRHNNRLKPKSSMDAQIIKSEGNLEKIYNLTKYHPTRSLQRKFTKTGKEATLQWSDLVSPTLTKWSKLTSPGMRRSDSTCLPMTRHFSGITAKSTRPECNHKETPDRHKLRHFLQNSWPIL